MGVGLPVLPSWRSARSTVIQILHSRVPWPGRSAG
jgi:hypothetical protein